jgi:hypothetical protein
MGKINKIIRESVKNQFIDIAEFDSSNITGITYDADNNKLYIMFHGTSVYMYDDVNIDEFNQLYEAESKGKQFRITVKNKPYTRIM